MSDHKTNPQSLLSATLPPLLPVGHRVGVNIQLQVVPQAQVMLVPGDRMRTGAHGIEVFSGDAWQPVPEEAEVFELGKPLPPEKCDLVAVLGSMVEDTLGPKLIVGTGQKSTSIAGGPLAVIARVPLAEWQRVISGALRGQVER